METNVTCWVSWCHDQPPNHSWHEGVITTLAGHDPHLRDVPRWLQLVAYAQEPSGHTGPLTPQLALTITGPDLRRPDRVSVTLDRADWRDLATEIRTTLTKSTRP